MPSTLSAPDGLTRTPDFSEGERQSAAQTHSVYPDYPPYSAISQSQVSSFNYPSNCDSTLLTPISAAGSPSWNQSRKLMRPYAQPPATIHQEQTPPGSCKMYPWARQIQLSGQSTEASSPTTTQAAVEQGFLDPYMQGARRTPEPPEPYMGHFAVSSHGNDSHSVQPHSYYVPVPHMEHPNGMMMRMPQPMTLDGQHERTVPPPAPLMNQPHPTQFRQQRRPSVEAPPIQGQSDASRSLSGSPRRRLANGRLSRPRRPSKRQSTSQRKPPQLINSSAEHQNCHGMEEPPCLKSTTSDEQRYVFEARWRHRDLKGQNMWESIQEDVQRAMDKGYSKETLQMIFARGRPECYEWHRKDLVILREAWLRMEQDRYRHLRDLFLELGGSRNMCTSASDIEIKVVNDLKLESNLYMDGGNENYVRKRARTRKGVAKKKSDSNDGKDDVDMHPSDEMMSASPYADPAMDAASVMDQVHRHRGVDFEHQVLESEDVEMQSYWDAKGPIKMEPGSTAATTNGHAMGNLPAEGVCRGGRH